MTTPTHVSVPVSLLESLRDCFPYSAARGLWHDHTGFTEGAQTIKALADLIPEPEWEPTPGQVEAFCVGKGWSLDNRSNKKVATEYLKVAHAVLNPEVK